MVSPKKTEIFEYLEIEMIVTDGIFLEIEMMVTDCVIPNLHFLHFEEISGR